MCGPRPSSCACTVVAIGSGVWLPHSGAGATHSGDRVAAVDSKDRAGDVPTAIRRRRSLMLIFGTLRRWPKERQLLLVVAAPALPHADMATGGHAHHVNLEGQPFSSRGVAVNRPSYSAQCDQGAHSRRAEAGHHPVRSPGPRKRLSVGPVPAAIRLAAGCTRSRVGPSRHRSSPNLGCRSAPWPIPSPDP